MRGDEVTEGGTPPESQAALWDRLCDRFEEAWKTGERPAIEQFLGAMPESGRPALFRELLEMRYLWQKPIGLDETKLRSFLGEVPATSLETAVREAMADLDIPPKEEAQAVSEAKSWTGGGATPYIAGHVRTHPA